MADVLRTPDEQFENLPDYDFTPHYLNIFDPELGEMRMHFVDVGPSDGQTVIMIHGEPSWSYLYRHMIRNVANAGIRVVAPDLIGFGRSDKPARTGDYSYSRHVNWIRQWFERSGIKNTVLFCQDWGGLLGLRLVAQYPDRFCGVIAANTFLPTGKGKPSPAFENWKSFSQTVPVFPAGGVIKGGTVKDLGPGVQAAYDAPFPDETYKAGARIFPALVPVSEDMDGSADNQAAWKVLSRYDKPFLTCFSDQDPVTAGGDKLFQKLIPGCAGQAHRTVKGGGHFLQEDCPEELSKIVIDFCARLPV